MGTMLLTYKIMPSSPEVDLEELEQEIKKVLEKAEGQKIGFAQEPVAFGLKSIRARFDLDESKDLDPIQKEIESIENISSVEMADMRRAFG
jgi:elongation factor 1-beta